MPGIIGSAASFSLQALQFPAVLGGDQMCDLFCKGRDLGMTSEVATADHRYSGAFRAGGQKLPHTASSTASLETLKALSTGISHERLV